MQSANRYDLSLGSNKTTDSITRQTGTYDVSSAEIRAKNEHENLLNNNTFQTASTTLSSNSVSQITQTNGCDNMQETVDAELKKKKWPTDHAYFLAKEILMTERTYKKDLEVINTVRDFLFNLILTFKTLF